MLLAAIRSLVLLVVLVATASDVLAEPRAFSATLEIRLGTFDTVQATGSGVADVEARGFSIPGGVLGFDRSVAVPDSTFIEAVGFSGSNAAGSFDTNGNVRGTMPLNGLAVLQLLKPPATATRRVLELTPIGTFGEHDWVAFSVTEMSPFGFDTTTYQLTLSLSGDRWRSDRLTVEGETSAGSPIAITTTGYDARTPGGAGTLQLVTPILVSTRQEGDFVESVPGFARLTLSFVPEPQPLLLAMAALVTLVGLLRLRSREARTVHRITGLVSRCLAAVPCVALAVALLLPVPASGAPTWSPEWRIELNNHFLRFPNNEDRALDIAPLPGGDVVAAGVFETNDAALCRFAAANGALEWCLDPDTTGSDFDYISKVVADGQGDVVALANWPDFATHYSVLKLAGGTGSLRWRTDVRVDDGQAVAAAAVGPVAVAGQLEVPNPPSVEQQVFFVAGLDPQTGTERWRFQTGRSFFGFAFSRAHAVALDAAGDVVAAGQIMTADNVFDSDFAVVKVNGVTGAERWRKLITGTYVDSDGAARSNDLALAVVVDGAGDVVAAGYRENGEPYRTFFVVKLSGATGAELWRRELEGVSDGGNEASALALDADEDVFAAGIFSADGASFGDKDFAVVKLSGSSGSVLWRKALRGSAGPGANGAVDVIADPAGNAIAVGYLKNETTSGDFVAVALAAHTGDVLLQAELDGTTMGNDRANAVTVDALGNVYAAGTVGNRNRFVDFALVKLPEPSAPVLRLAALASLALLRVRRHAKPRS